METVLLVKKVINQDNAAHILAKKVINQDNLVKTVLPAKTMARKFLDLTVKEEKIVLLVIKTTNLVKEGVMIVPEVDVVAVDADTIATVLPPVKPMTSKKVLPLKLKDNLVTIDTIVKTN